MADIPLNLFTLVFGVLIFGIGYVGIFTRYLLLGKKNFYEFNIWDKGIQSVILGTISFIFAMNSGFIKIELVNEQEMLSYVLFNPQIFIYQFLFVFLFIYLIIILELYFNLIKNNLPFYIKKTSFLKKINLIKERKGKITRKAERLFSLK